MRDTACSEGKTSSRWFSDEERMTKPTPDEIQQYFKAWWLENYMVPLNKTPMGVVEFISAFYDKYCTESEDSADS